MKILDILIFLTIQTIWNQISHIHQSILRRLHVVRPRDYENLTVSELHLGPTQFSKIFEKIENFRKHQKSSENQSPGTPGTLKLIFRSADAANQCESQSVGDS